MKPTRNIFKTLVAQFNHISTRSETLEKKKFPSQIKTFRS